MKTSERAEHRFGGSWTEIKLNAVSDYLNFYTRALQASPSPENPFETWYVDAFAGTGDRTVEPKAGTLFSVEGVISSSLRRTRAALSPLIESRPTILTGTSAASLATRTTKSVTSSRRDLGSSLPVVGFNEQSYSSTPTACPFDGTRYDSWPGRVVPTSGISSLFTRRSAS